nr:hypothetical protein [uncultured Methanolobus sp.]
MKGQVLSTLVQNELTVKEMQNIVQHPNFNSFKAEISQLKRRGYITVSENTRPKTYKLTKKGHEHAANPFITIIRRQESIAAKVSAILNDDDAFQKAVQEEASRMSSGGHVSGHGGVISTPTASIDDSKVQKLLQAKDDEIEKLKRYVLHLRQSPQSQAPTGPMSTRTQGQPMQQTPEQQHKQQHKAKSEARRIKKRKHLAHAYYSKGVFLDNRFFSLWGEVAPHKIKFKRYISSDGTVAPDSIEIMSSKSNLEIKRGHAHRKPIGDALMRRCMFHIVKIDDRGIDIKGHGLPGNKARLRF